MAWTWRFKDAAGNERPQSDVALFESQSDAENYIGDTWRTLLAEGIESVELLDDGASVYVMSLQPPTL